MTREITRIAAIVLGLTAGAEACTIPVFRYALDRWRADDYGLVASEGWWDGEAGKRLAAMQSDLEMNLSAAPPGENAREMQVLRPENGEVIWSGELDEKSLAALTSSPAREELAKRIVSGESAVWVMVESGDEKLDKEFGKMLEGRLAYLEQVATIPPQDPNDPDSQLGPGPDLKVDFSVLRVKRDDPKEELFVKMLAGPDGGKLLSASEPFAAPVFARGRVLGAWEASKLDEEGVDEVSLFLLGACSCRVKNLNPGWELLMAVNWDERLMAVEMAAAREPAEESEGGNPGGEPLPELEVVEFGKPAAEKPGVEAVSPKAGTRTSEFVLGFFMALVAGIVGWKNAR